MQGLTEKTAVKDDSSQRLVRELTLCGVGGEVGGSDDVIGDAAVLCSDKPNGTDLMMAMMQQFMVQQVQQNQLFMQCLIQCRQDSVEQSAWMRRNATGDLCVDDVPDSVLVGDQQAVVCSTPHQYIEWSRDSLQGQPVETTCNIISLYSDYIEYANVCVVTSECVIATESATCISVCETVNSCTCITIDGTDSILCTNTNYDCTCTIVSNKVENCDYMSVSQEYFNTINNLCEVIVPDQCVEYESVTVCVCNVLSNGVECICSGLYGSVPVVIVGMLYTGKSVRMRPEVSASFVYVQCTFTVVCVLYTSVYRGKRHVCCFVLICVKLNTMYVLFLKFGIIFV